jgi:EF hand
MQRSLPESTLERTMKTLKILTAAVFATFAVAAYAGPFGPAGAGCPAGATPGSAACPGTGPGAGYGQRGAGFQERLQAADTNADGRISREEAQAGLPRLYENFDAIDANHDGFVSTEEMQGARQAHRGGGHARGEGWKQWDANGDGRLSREEVANAPRLSQQFDTIDANHDGFVTVEELQAARAQFAGRGPNRGS